MNREIIEELDESEYDEDYYDEEYIDEHEEILDLDKTEKDSNGQYIVSENYTLTLNEEKIIIDMSDMIRCKTISNRDMSLVNFAEFEKFKAKLIKMSNTFSFKYFFICIFYVKPSTLCHLRKFLYYTSSRWPLFFKCIRRHFSWIKIFLYTKYCN